MMPADSTEVTGLEPTYSAREAAIVLTRSYSWLDQRVRKCEFTQPDGTVVRPLRSPGGYRYFTVEMLRDIATCCYRHRWFSFRELKSVFQALALADDHGAAADAP
ncbi:MULTISPECIES: hypothetical protein [Mycobacterium]|uniref:DUF7229 domain-containing protein n=1 Tax=Mycobacterium colombiense TaxID=339268 RepID=A0A329M612_9MYCO|nr:MULTISPECIES: hypothetical protein [Mycobacterium]MDM4138796.1 hypothetical protein [Mycobacterium sp. FLAC0960]RAV14083.1 hypothetical protein DQP57_06875 [Mycobacterium colombiense]